MEFLNSWLQGIIIAVVVATIIEMILPSGNSKKYIKVVLGVYIVFNIITPVVNQFLKSDFELSSILNIEEYAKKMETYEVDTKNINIEESNQQNIKQIYQTNLKKDIKAKLEEKGYEVKKIEMELAKEEEYQIKQISLWLEKKKEEKEEVIENEIKIQEIEEVEIKIGESKQEELPEEKSKLTEKEKKEIKEYVASVYEIKEITIYERKEKIC